MDTAEGTGSVLKWPDYLVLGIVLSISAAIGVYYRFTGGRQRTAEEYFAADRSMRIVPLAIALMVSFISAITVLGISAENYVHGTQFMLLYAGGIISAPIAVYFYLPVFYELGTTSIYEYLEKRFGMTARLMASSANFLQLLLYSGVVLFAPSLALEATTGLSGTTSVLLLGLICTFYSTVGGIKAVLITDVFQGALMLAGVAAVLVAVAKELGGSLADVWPIAVEGGRVNFFDFRFDPTIRHTWWCLTIGGLTIFLSVHAVNQVQVQRLLTAKNKRSSQIALLLSVPLGIIMSVFTCFTGLAVYAVYKDCDPVLAGKISTADKIMPLFSVEKMGWAPGLTGLFISGIFSASLSTISAMLNSLAAVAIEDYVKPAYRAIGAEFPEEKTTLMGKIFAATNGLVCLAIAFLARSFGTLTEAALGMSGAISGPILGIFTLGMSVESANEFGAITGLCSALAICLWAAFGRPKPIAEALPRSIDGCDNSTLASIPVNVTAPQSDADEKSYFYLNRISYMWYNPMGLTIALLVGYLASLATRRFYRDGREPDPELFFPCLKARIKRRRGDAQKTAGSQVFVLEPIGR